MVATVLNALRNNALFFVIHMVAQNPIGLFLAVLLARRIRGSAYLSNDDLYPNHSLRGHRRFCLEIDFKSGLGISRTILGAVGLSGLGDTPWLGLESTTLTTLSLISVWQNVGIPMMLFGGAYPSPG